MYTSPFRSSTSETIGTSEFAKKHGLQNTPPGQFWLHITDPQSPMSSGEPGSGLNDSSTTSCPGEEDLQLKDFLLWDLASKSKPSSLSVDPELIREFAFHALKSLPALRLLVERNRSVLASGDASHNKAPFCDFHEWASPTENVSYSNLLIGICVLRGIITTYLFI